MALKIRELFEQLAGEGSQKRIAPENNMPKEFATNAGSALIPAGALVAYEVGAVNGWVPFEAGGADGAEIMAGICWPDAIQLDDVGESIGQVMLTGRVHRDDIELNGELQADIDAQLRTVARTLNIHVDGLTDVR